VLWSSAFYSFVDFCVCVGIWDAYSYFCKIVMLVCSNFTNIVSEIELLFVCK
jgi:hypothetical protein